MPLRFRSSKSKPVWRSARISVRAVFLSSLNLSSMVLIRSPMPPMPVAKSGLRNIWLNPPQPAAFLRSSICSGVSISRNNSATLSSLIPSPFAKRRSCSVNLSRSKERMPPACSSLRATAARSASSAVLSNSLSPIPSS